MQFAEKFVAFVDILGFKDMVKDSESGTGRDIGSILELLQMLGCPELQERVCKHGPTFCPESRKVAQDLDYKVTQISDCVVISAEKSPSGILQVVNHCWLAAFKLLNAGILCRGYVTMGSVFHTDHQVIGSAYINAFHKEREVSFLRQSEGQKGTPFIEIDPAIVSYINDCGDNCVQEIFGRMTKSHGNLTAIFPFKVLQHSFLIGNSDQASEISANNKVRQRIIDLIDKIAFQKADEDKASDKISHYLGVLQDQLIICNQTEDLINSLYSPFPRQT